MATTPLPRNNSVLFVFDVFLVEHINSHLVTGVRTNQSSGTGSEGDGGSGIKGFAALRSNIHHGHVRAGVVPKLCLKCMVVTCFYNISLLCGHLNLSSYL